MRAEEIQHCAEDRGIAKAGAQIIGREPGQREEALSAGIVFQQPAKSAKRQCLRIGGG